MRLNKIEKEFVRKRVSIVYPEGTRMHDWAVGRVSAFIDLGDAVVFFEKPTISTDFYFGEHGFDYDEVCKTCHELSKSEHYFTEENVRRNCRATDILRLLDALESGDTDYETRYCVPALATKYGDDSGLGRLLWHDRSQTRELPFGGRVDDDPAYVRDLTVEEVSRLRKVAEKEAECYRKRLTSYLKRYGLSKCRFSTYWADR